MAAKHMPTVRGSEWLTFLRCLAILNRLLRGPATGDELIQAVWDVVGVDAYPVAPPTRKHAFKHDREALRERFKAVFHFDWQENVYRLDEPGPFGVLDLPDAALQGLPLLDTWFSGELGERADVRALLDAIYARLSPQVQRKLEDPAVWLALEIGPGMDQEPVNPVIWDKVRRAVRERRKLAFHYCSREHVDGLARYHHVAPLRVQLSRGHIYLYAYDLLRREPDGAEQRDAGYRQFRLDRIVADERLEILPDKLSPGMHKPPRILVVYRLLPPLSRGAISRHFDDMTIDDPLPDGSVQIRGYTENAWQAVRLLLGYGENCLVLGGDEVLRLIRRRVEKMARLYHLPENDF